MLDRAPVDRESAERYIRFREVRPAAQHTEVYELPVAKSLERGTRRTAGDPGRQSVEIDDQSVDCAVAQSPERAQNAELDSSVRTAHLAANPGWSREQADPHVRAVRS